MSTSIAFVNKGTGSGGTTTITPSFPAVTSGNILLLVVTNKYPTNAPTTPSGWTLITNAQKSGGSGSSGADTGQVYCSVYYKISDGTETKTQSVSIPIGNSAMGIILQYSIDATSTWDTPHCRSASQNTGGTASWSATSATDPNILVDDLIVCCSGINTDLYTYSAEAMSCSGCTFGTVNERVDNVVTNGDDVGTVVADAFVTAGASTGTITFTMTASGSATNNPAGATVFYVLREIRHYTLVAGTGAFSIASTGTNLLWKRVLSAGSGAYSIAGAGTSLLWNRVLSAAAGAFAIAGAGTSLLWNRLLSAATGAFTLAGAGTSLLWNRVLNAETGAYTIVGGDLATAGFIQPTGIASSERVEEPEVTRDGFGIALVTDRKAFFMPKKLIPGPLPRGRKGRIGLPMPKRKSRPILFPIGFGGAWAPGLVSPPGGSGPIDRPCVLVDFTIGANWFNRIHILPRTPINFERFITPQQQTIEIFNAFNQSTELTEVNNPLDPGVTVEDLPTLPYKLLPYSSLLGVSIRTSEDGPLKFDDQIGFVFSVGNQVFAEILGLRVPIIPWKPSGNITENLQFGTSVLRILRGKEQRISYRVNPRQYFEVPYLFDIDGDPRREINNLLFGRQSEVIALPLWHESVSINGALVTVGDSVTIPVSTTVGVDLRVGGYLMIRKSDSYYDVAKIESVSSNSIVVTSVTLNSYAIGDIVMPIRFVNITSAPRNGRNPVGVASYVIQCLSVDNDTGASDGSLIGFSTYNGRLILDQNNFMNGSTKAEAFIQEVEGYDSLSGVRQQFASWDRNKDLRDFGFLTRNRAELRDFRNLILALKGKLISFYCPQIAVDLKATQDLTNGDDTITVRNNNYTQYANGKEGRNIFKITFSDETSLIRKITASEVLSETEELLTLDATWPSTKTISQIVLVEWINLVRFDSDEVKIQHRGIGRARATVPILAVEDDG